MKLKLISSLILLAFFASACGKHYTEAEKEYIAKIEKQRAEKDEWMRTSPNSPFNHKHKVPFEPLKYYHVDPSWVYHSKLYEYPEKDSLVIYGTKGEARPTVRFGYVKFERDGKEYKLNVYKSRSRRGVWYYSIWFTDKTTGDETYGVGRYLDFEKSDDPEHVYEIDFNLAYNPYCAYSHDYSCAIPSKEDYLDLAVTAGEKKFH